MNVRQDSTVLRARARSISTDEPTTFLNVPTPRHPNVLGGVLVDRFQEEMVFGHETFANGAV